MITVAGIKFDHAPRDANQVIAMAQRVLPVLLKKTPTEQDFYWFLIEQYDRLHGHYSDLDGALETVGLHEFEYEGRRSAESYPRKPNPGVVFLEEQVRKPIAADADAKLTHYVLIAIYTAACAANEGRVNELRRKYATQYHNNCVEKGSFNMAEKWVEVLNMIPASEPTSSGSEAPPRRRFWQMLGSR